MLRKEVYMRHIDTQIMALRQEFVTMGLEVLEAVRKAVTAFEEGDDGLAREVIEHDEVINGKETHLERKSAQVIALQQPVTMDLREIISILKASADLERLGDHAVSIARETIRVKGNPRVPQIEEKISAMTAEIRKMLEQVLDAYVKGDETVARSVAKDDLKIDEQYNECRDLIVKEMQHETKTAVATSSYLMVVRLLERIGDHIVNLSEWIVYTKNGHLVELNEKE